MARSSPMRAIQITEFGGPEVLQLVDLPEPEPADGEVLIKVTKAGVNFADTHQRHNQYVAKAELPLIPGSEVAGVREDNGERVIALTGTGRDAECGVAPADRIWPIPDGVDDDTAVALLIQGLTAWHLHRTAAQLRKGETVVVHSAAGGTGSLTLPLAQPRGAGRTIASASTEEKRATLEADAVIDSDPDGLGERLLEANDGNEVDVVYDIAGGRSVDESFGGLPPLGRIVVSGIAPGEQNETRTGKLLRTSRSVVGFWFFHLLERPGTIEPALADLFERAARGELRAQVGATYGLADAARAQTELAERRTTGKVLLQP